MNSLNDDIAKYLADEGVGTLGTDVFADNYPAAPQNLVAVIPAAGNQYPDVSVRALRYPAAQVMVRNIDHNDAVTKCEEIRALLHVLIGKQLDNYFILRSHLRFEFQPLGHDVNGLWEFTATFDIEAR